MDDIEYIPDKHLSRASLEDKSNILGSKLLNLCKSTGLRIVNRRVYGDHNLGSYTFVSTQRASAVDYLLTYENIFTYLSNFLVESMHEWSDHTPICFYLCNCKRSIIQEDYTEIKCKWNENIISNLFIEK